MLNYSTNPGSTGKNDHTVKYLVLFFLICFQFSLVNKAASQWVWQNPLPQGNTLYGASFLDGNNIMAVGAAGTTIKSTNGGNNWSNYFHGTDANFGWFQVSYIAPNTAIAAGLNVAAGPSVNTGIFKTTDGGITWTNIYNSLTAYLFGVNFVDANTGLVLGNSLAGGTILKTTDAGNTWMQQSSGTTFPLWDAHFTDVNTCTIIGEGGTILRTTNGGDNWVQQTSGTSTNLSGVFFSDNNTGTTVGENGTILRTTDAGATWSAQVSGVTATLEDVCFTSQTNGTVVGQGVILATTDGGNTWTVNSQITGLSFNSVTFANAAVGIAVGINGAIIRTTDGGQNWTQLSMGVTSDLRSVFFPTRSFGIAAGFSGTILRTTNEGLNWVSVSSGTTASFFGAFFVGTNTGTVVGTGGTVLRTTDGGNTWLPQNSGLTQVLNDVYFTDVNTGTAVGSAGRIIRTVDGGNTWTQQTSGATQVLNDICFIDANTGIIAAAAGRILRTTNGGENWSVQTVGSAALNGLFFIDANNGFAVGAAGRMLKTTNAGINWSVLTSGTTNALQSVFFSDANTGIAAGSLGTIIKTTNGGTSWTIQTSGAETLLYDIFFTNGNTATAVGNGGTILHTGAPASNYNFGSNNKTGDNLYYFANSLPAASGSPSQPEFLWRDTTGSISLYADGANQAPGIFTGDEDNGRWNLLNRLAGGNIRFFGTNYSDVYIGTNGVLGFNAFDPSAAEPPLSGLNQSNITEAVFPLWMNMNVGYGLVTGRRISYKVTESELVVTYSRIPVYGYSSLTNDPGRYVSFQVIIKLNGPPVQNSVVFISYNYDETGPLFISEYNEGILRTHLVGIQKNNDSQQFFQYRFRNAFSLATEGPLFGSNMTIAAGPDQNILPVELSSFTASVKNRDVNLNWITISEENNAGYDIERSARPNEWSKIAFVKGNGTTNESKNYFFTDKGLSTGKYKYRLKQTDYNGNYEYFNLSNEIIIGVPEKYNLSQNYPNPFNPVTKINFDLPADGIVTMKIFDVMGREVATIVNEYRTAGYHTVTFDAKGIASGIYFYRITAGTEGQYMMTRKMMVIK